MFAGGSGTFDGAEHADEKDLAYVSERLGEPKGYRVAELVLRIAEEKTMTLYLRIWLYKTIKYRLIFAMFVLYSDSGNLYS